MKMDYLNNFDYGVIMAYFAMLVMIGLYLKKKASGSLEDYFLAGRSLPWWLLGISGMGSFVDMTGTMIITSFLFMLGMQGLFVEFRGGVCLVLIPMMLWTGKWHRRSGCITGAEWMIYRFGEDVWGQMARIVRAVAEIIFTVGMLAYLIKGAGLFLSMFLPFSPLVCALIMIGIGTLYTMISGFYGVVFNDALQSMIILFGVVYVSIVSFTHFGSMAEISVLVDKVVGRSDWFNVLPAWQTNMPKGYEMYESLTMFAIIYLIRNILWGMGTGDDPKYFGARNDAECGKLSFLWIWLMMFRWPLMMGFAILGMVVVNNLFSNNDMLVQAAALIKAQVGQVDQSRWADTIANIIASPENYSGLAAQLQSLLGDDWQGKLNLVGYHGTVDPERILPAVIIYGLPKGVRGLLLVVLMAAALSTFDSTVNKTTGFFTRDLYQRYLRPKAGNRELISVSWAFTLLIPIVGMLMAYTAKSINDIWGWLIMGLGSGLMVPYFLKFYWWRFNGGGFAISLFSGLVAALVQRAVYPQLNELWQFALVLTVGIIGAILGTFLTKPTAPGVLEHFYRTTRPFGFWGPLKPTLAQDVRKQMTREHTYDLMAVPFTLVWQVSLFLLPMELITHNFKAFWPTLAVFIFCLLGIYYFWYRQLPAKD